jgi:hypothetical protein
MRANCLVLAVALPLLAGCLPYFKRDDGPKGKDLDRVSDTKATPASLSRYLNKQSDLLTSVKARMAADVSAGGRAIAIDGTMACEKPKGFRLRANTIAGLSVDIGSNNDEFWFWIKQGDPYQFYCSYRELADGKVAVPLPFQPEMVLVALGMAKYDPDGTGYELKDHKADNTLELIVSTTSPDGKSVKRSVLFRRTEEKRPGMPQVVGHILRDASGKVLCEAKVTAVHVDRETGAVVPSRMELKWPSEKDRPSMKLMLDGIQVNTVTREDAGRFFVREPIPGVKAFDLARGRPDGESASSRSMR